MAVDRADLAVVRRIVYDNLGVTNQTGGYGTLQSNERYLTGYIDDAISIADLETMKTLLKQKQYHFASDYFSNSLITSPLPVQVPENAEIISVHHYSDTSGTEYISSEVPYEVYDLIKDGGLFDTTYKGYFAFKDGYLYHISDEAVPYNGSNTTTQFEYALPPTLDTLLAVAHGKSDGDRVYLNTSGTLPAGLSDSILYYIVNSTTDEFQLALTAGGTPVSITDGGAGTHTFEAPSYKYGYIKYIQLVHESSLTTLNCPESFEGAIANYASAYLLMKRGDQPDQAQFYMQLYGQQMQNYMTPSTNQQRYVDR